MSDFSNNLLSAIFNILKTLWYLFIYLFHIFLWIIKLPFYLVFGSNGTSASHSASFLDGFDRKMFLNRFHSGLVLEKNKRISQNLSFQHALVLAPSGAGKTVSYIIPNVLSLKDSSAVVTDPAGEIYKLAYLPLLAKGFNVKVFDLSDVNKSLKFNPLERINSFSDIAKISAVLIDSAFPDDTGSSFWNDSAKLIVSITIRALKSKYKHEANLRLLYEHLNYFNTDKQNVLDLVFASHLDDSSFQEYKAFMSQDIKVLSSVLSTAKTALSKLSDPDIAKITDKDTINFEKLREEKTVFFIIIPENDVKYYSFLITLLYTQLFNFAMKDKKEFNNYIPIYFLLDEFANTGKIPSFSTIITTLRKRKCSLSLVIQDFQQIYHLYGKNDGATIISNANNKIYFPGLSLQTVSEIERSLGKVRKISIDQNGYEKEIVQPLLHLDQIRMLPKNIAIFISFNEKPVLLKLTPYFKNRRLKKMLGI